MGKPTIPQIDANMGDAPAASVLRTKEDEIPIDEIVVVDSFSHFCLISGDSRDTYTHLSIDVVSQSRTVKSIRPLFCPDIGFVHMLLEKFLDIFSIGLASFGGFDNIIIGITIGLGSAGGKEQREGQ